MRLIDANALIDWLTKATGFRTNCDDCTDIDCLDCIIEEAIKNAPTIEAKPVVHGNWKEWYPPKEFVLTREKRLFICSCCDAKFETVENSRYCPYCGATMDERKGEKE